MTNSPSAFKEETLELLALLEGLLVDLEHDIGHSELVPEIFRILHTIKGTGGMFGFHDIATFTHEIENVFDLVRQERMPVSRQLIGLSLAARDQIKLMVIGDRKETADMAIIGKLVLEFRQLAATTTDQPLPRRFVIEFAPHPSFFQSGNSLSHIFQDLHDLGTCRVTAHTETIPTLEELDPECCYSSWTIELEGICDENALHDVFIFAQEFAKVQISPCPFPESTNGKLPQPQLSSPPSPITRENFSPVARKTPSLTTVSAPPRQDGSDHFAGKVDRSLYTIRKELTEMKDPDTSESSESGQESIRVPSGKLNHLVDLIGELVTVQARLSQTANSRHESELASISEELERLTEDLRDSALKIRMLPLNTIAGEFRNLMKEWGGGLGKPVEFSIAGGETELDKTILEKLREPLIHLLRNAVIHGIEAQDLRRSTGKNPRGRISLQAHHSGGHFCLEICDDGAGIDVAAVHRRAVDMGIQAAHETLLPADMVRILSHPGLSVANAPEPMAGMGLHMAKRAVDSLRGTLDLSTNPGQGTTISIQLPLTLAIIEGLLVSVQKQLFVLPLVVVEECIELTREEERRAYDKNVVMVRGQLVPYIRLRETFAIPGAPPAIQQIVIANIDQQRVGFVVDQVIGEYQTVIKSLGNFYRHVRGISGATILGDGTVALILELGHIMKEEQHLGALELEEVA
jgi:two-component system chemotaxis sensor kinase CheA